VVEGGKCPRPCKKGGGIVWEGEMSEGKMSRGIVLHLNHRMVPPAVAACVY